MKLLTYDTGTGPRCGVLQGDSVVDVTALLGEPGTIRDVGALLALDESSVDRVGGRAGRARGGSGRGAGCGAVALAHIAAADGARLHRLRGARQLAGHTGTE